MSIRPSSVVAALLLLSALDARAVSVREARETAGGVIFRSFAGELHFAQRDGAKGAIIGRLPKQASPLVGDGEEAWAYALPWDRPARLFMARGERFAEIIPTFEPEVGSLGGLNWVVGCDESFVYLLGPKGSRARLDRATSRIEAGHLDAHPDLTIVATRRVREGHVLMARDDADPPRAWLSRAPGLRVPLDMPMKGFPHLAAGEDELLVATAGALLLVDPCTLELRADLSDVKPEGPVLFASVDSGAAWLRTRGMGCCAVHWRIDLVTREVAEAAPPSGRERHALVADDGEHLWFARVGALGASAAPIAVAKAGGEVARLNLEGPPGSGFRVVPRALKGGAAMVLYLPIVVAGAVGGGY